MNPELKSRWIAALRSGHYQQGQGALRSAGNKYCCLGVLCDIMAPGEWAEISNLRFTHLKCTDAPSKELCTGLNRASIRKLSRLNDSEDGTFPEIADWIEQNL